MIVFSIIIPCLSLSNCLINECLPAIDKQTYKNFEAIILPNKKSGMDKLFLKKYSWLKIIPSKEITAPALKRNLGAQKARVDILAFIDDDAYPDKNWLINAFKLFQRSSEPQGLRIASQQSKGGIVSICGPGILPIKSNIWERIFDEILKSPIGSGSYTFRFTQKKERFVDDYPSMNFLIKKEVFNRLGGFNNNYWPGEDSKLCEDIVYKENGLIHYHPDVLVYHHRRNNLYAFLKQHAQYGFHRGAFFVHGDRNSRRLTYLIPTFFVFYLFSIFALLTFRLSDFFFSQLSINNYQLTIIFPLFSYFILQFYLFLKAFVNTKNVLISLLSPLFLFLTHLTYGIMFVRGYIKGIRKKDKIYS